MSERATRAAVIVLSLGAVGLLLLPTRTLNRVRHYPQLPEIDVEFVMLKEREAGNIGTAYVVSFLPQTVQEIPPFGLLAQDGPERLEQRSLPAETVVVDQEYAPLRYTLYLSGSEQFTATFNTFFFPGWRAQLDREALPLAPDEPYGRIRAHIPAGEHRLEVWFGSTPPRLLAGGSSLLGLAALVSAAIALNRRTTARRLQPAAMAPPEITGSESKRRKPNA